MPKLNPADRPIPTRRVATTEFRMPDRLLRDHALNPTTRLVAAAICAEARRGAAACAPTNERLARVTGLSPRAVQYALVRLEGAGWVHRLHDWDEFTLDQLRWAGFVDPWDRDGCPRPPRALVLLWRLPAPALEPGDARRCTPGDASRFTPRRPGRGGTP